MHSLAVQCRGFLSSKMAKENKKEDKTDRGASKKKKAPVVERPSFVA